MATDSGYSNQKKKGRSQFETVHSSGSGSFSKKAINTSVYEKLGGVTANDVTEVFGSDGQVQYWNVNLASHTAIVGDMCRVDLVSSGTGIFEYEIVEVIDPDNFYILPISEVIPTNIDIFSIFGYVSNRVSSSGDLVVSISSAPTQYNYDGSPQTVEQDTTTFSNNRALPNLNFIYKDGNQVPITKDTGNPSNTVGMPVELVAASGTPINITAGDLNVQLTDLGANFDATRVGDGSGNYIKVNANGSTDVNVLGSVAVTGALTDAQLRSTPVPVSGTVSTGLSQPLTDTQLRASPVPVSAASLPLPTGAATETTLSSIDTKTPALVSGRVPVDGSAVTQPISASSLPLPTGAASESTLSAISAKLPAALGQLGEAASFSVALATEHEALLNDIKSNTAARVINSMSQSTTTTSATLTAPAGARGFTIQNSTRANGALRFTQSGGGASATVGFLLEPGQSTSYQEGASSLSVFAVDGTAIDACVIWYV